MQSNKITITGDLGSGKSAVSRILCREIGFEYLSTGQVQRKLAADLGIDTLEMNRRADTDPTIDQRIDSVFIDLSESPDGYIVDSRMAWFFMPGSFKVFLQADVAVAADRILSDPLRNSEQYESKEEAIAKILARKKSENDRFLVKYGADGANLDNFDLVVDTTQRTPEEVADIILASYEARNEGLLYEKRC
jgi:cytidylate kinase